MATAPTPELDARFSDPHAQPTPWSEVERTITEAELFWISTVRPDGRPHVTPMPAVWHDGTLYFCTGAGEQKAVNLARNARCALTTGTNAWKSGLDVVVEGTARQVTDETLLQRLADGWRTKYHGDWDYEVRDGHFHQGGIDADVYEMVADKILAFAKGDFAQTRFRP
jgi:general stress protein 26